MNPILKVTLIVQTLAFILVAIDLAQSIKHYKRTKARLKKWTS